MIEAAEELAFGGGGGLEGPPSPPSRIGLDAGPCSHVEAPEGGGPSMSSELADLIAHMREVARDDETHRATCRESYCDRCGRHRCRGCRQAVVSEDDERCWSCLIAAHVPSIGLPARYAGAGFGVERIDALRRRVRSPRAIEQALRLAQRATMVSAIFAGGAGAGKSTLASAAAGQRMATALRARPLVVPSIRWVSAIDIGLARQRHRLGSEDEPALVADAITADLLVVDDLGAEGARDHDAVAQVYHGRHDADLPTWTTTGLTSPELAARYGGGLARRIAEHATVIRCDPPPKK